MLEVTKNYTGRQVDLEFLQEVRDPLPHVEVAMRLGNPRVSRNVAGVQKVVQRYVLLFLTQVGSTRNHPAVGTRSISQLQTNAARGPAAVRQVFELANRKVLAAMRSDDVQFDVFGALPADEIILAAELRSSSYNPHTSTLSLEVWITLQAGSVFSFVIPTPIPIR